MTSTCAEQKTSPPQAPAQDWPNNESLTLLGIVSDLEEGNESKAGANNNSDEVINRDVRIESKHVARPKPKSRNERRILEMLSKHKLELVPDSVINIHNLDRDKWLETAASILSKRMTLAPHNDSDSDDDEQQELDAELRMTVHQDDAHEHDGDVDDATLDEFRSVSLSAGIPAVAPRQPGDVDGLGSDDDDPEFDDEDQLD